MEENKNLEQKNISQVEENEGSSINFATIYSILILNWKWFVLSLLICVGLASIYLRYTTPIYQASAKLLIKDDDGGRGGSSNSNMLQNATNLGLITQTNGIDNEMEILTSCQLAKSAVRDLKLNVSYSTEGRIKDVILYKNQPITVSLDPLHMEKLNMAMPLVITRSGNTYTVKGSYRVPLSETEASEELYKINKSFTSLPISINTRAGILTLSRNEDPAVKTLAEGKELKVVISPLSVTASRYASSLNVTQTSKTTTIAQLVISDPIPQRAIDYLQQLAVVYNRQANEDKNEIAVRTEEFINGRLEKINAELGSTEGQLENYKKQHKMVELKMNATAAVSNSEVINQKLLDATTQVQLLNSIGAYMDDPVNKYQTLPSNVGLSDQSATTLINSYNQIVLQRNALLRSANENSPTVTPLTAQLDDLVGSIKRAMRQARKNMDIERNNIAKQYDKYQGIIGETPEQERILTQIGRQQEVKSGLYLMLLQKREENSISLAATADKGKLIDQPTYGGQVSPKKSMIMLIGLVMGLAIPALILFIIQFLKYKIEGHEDVARLTTLPIIADVCVASDTAKTRADIVVHENKNNQMEEIFRSMRTNLQFMLKNDEKVIMFTSSTSGEGKTFNASNLAVSFALLGKKVVLVGLDIRKPRLAELFENGDHTHGITPLLTKDNPTLEDIKKQILPSNVNDNLDLLLAGPTPPNPTELLARESLDNIITILRENYDYIILDTAPVGLVSDTLQVGRVADATICLCRADFTPKESFALINSLAKENKLPNMCIVLNGIDMSKKKYGYYYGYGKYGKYGHYASYGRYGHYSNYGHYGNYGSYGNYSNSHYGDKHDTSVKLK